VRCIVGASASSGSTCLLAFDFVFILVVGSKFMLKRCHNFVLDVAFRLSMRCGFVFVSECVPI